MNYLKLLILCSVFSFQCDKAKTPTLTDLNLLPDITFYPYKEDILGRWETATPESVLCSNIFINIKESEDGDFEIGTFCGYPVFTFDLTGNISESISEDEYKFKLDTYSCIDCKGPSSPGGTNRTYSAVLSGFGTWFPKKKSMKLKLGLSVYGDFSDSFFGTIEFTKTD